MRLSLPTLSAVSRSLAVAGCLATVVGCGVSTNESPEELSQENLPPELGGQENTSSPVLEGEDLEQVQLWFLQETSGTDRLLESIDSGVQPSPTPGIVLERLFTFPGEDLGDRGMRSAIPQDSRVTENPRIDGDDSVLRLELSESFYDELAEGDGRYAYGQIVLTMANRFDVEAVQFMIDGENAPVTDGRGTEQKGGLVEPTDYVNLADLGG